MDDVSDFFKSGFLSLHKNTLGKNYLQKTLKDRMNNFNNIRRETRNTLMFKKRQIDENMTPISTPEPTKLIKNIVEKKEVKKPNKRLEMLNKWKADKEKRKEEEKKKSKPLFKVCHVPVEIGLPSLESINKEIKGKPIKTNPTPIKSQFAPPNHKFRAPKNIKSINIYDNGNNTSLVTKPKIGTLKTRSSEMNKSNSKQNPVVSQRNTRAVTSRIGQINKLGEKQNSTLSNKSQAKSEINPKRNNVILKRTAPINPKIENKSSSRPKIKEPAQKSTSNISIRNKLQFKDNPALDSTAGKDVNCSSSKRNKRDEKTSNKKAPLVKSASLILDKNQLRNKDKCKKSYDCDVKTTAEVRKSLKENKIMFEELPNSKKVDVMDEKRKSLRIMKQSKLKENKVIKTPDKTRKSTYPTCKKIVGWNVIEIVDSDDEVFSTEINNKTPKKVIRKYNKTPRRGRKTETVEDIITEEILSNEENPEENEQNFSSVSENSNNKTPIKSDDQEAEQTVLKSRNSTVGSATGSASPDFPIESKSLNTSLHTPAKSVSREVSPVYISPFVTVSRGKNSARKEYQVRQSMGGSLGSSPEFNKDISNNVSPKAGADYFTRKLKNEITRIESMCDEWSKYKDQNDYPEEANDMIDVAIGQSKLLISKKFQQFRSLIEQCRSCEYIEKPITCKDLHGFWDMIYMQVEDLNKRFNRLGILKANDWQEVVPEKKPVVKRGRGRPKKASASSTLKNLIKAARNKKKSNDEGGNTLIVPQIDETVLSSGYDSNKSPIRERKTPIIRTSNVRTSLRASLLAGQAKSRISSSPGLTMMKITQAIKCGDGLTPSKSILKTDLTKSANKITKSVLFKDDLEDNIDKHFNSTKSVPFKNLEDINKENDRNEVNLIIFSPITPTRRSRRLSKIN